MCDFDKHNFVEEGNRLHFIMQRDGLNGAINFARQTMKIYRTSVVKKTFASSPVYKETFIKSYLDFKRFIKENE